MKNADVFTLAGYQNIDLGKNEKQKQFLLDTRPYLLYSGGFGSGKTTICNLKGLVLSAMVPNNLGVVCRQTYPDLRETTRENFLSLTPPEWIKYWRESENALTLKNGSAVLFRHFENKKIKVGANLGWFFIDQAEEADKHIFLALQGRLRRRVGKRYGMLAMNPNGKDWQWKMFVGRKHLEYGSYHSSSYDNKDNLPEGYIETLLENYPQDWIDRFVHGTWTTMSGLIFHEFNPDLHLVDPFIIPQTWIKCRGLDWGVDAPTTCVHAAVSPDGRRFVFAEYGDTEKTPPEHAASILTQSRPFNPYRASIIDQHAFHREKDLKSVADQFRTSGLLVQPATRDVLASIMHVKWLLKTNKLFFFRGMTKETLVEIESWKWGPPRSGKEVPARGNDHYLDAMRYVLYWMDRKYFYRGNAQQHAGRERGKDMGARLTIARQEANDADPITGLPA